MDCQVCIPDIQPEQACAYRSYSFERIRKSLLEGFVKKTLQVGTRSFDFLRSLNLVMGAR